MEVNANEWMAHSDFLAHYGVPGMKWGRRKGPSTLDRYKKHRKTEKQYNEDLALYGKKGAKRIADDMDNKTTLKGARSKEAGKYKNAVKSVKKGKRLGETIGANAGALAGYAGYYALRRLAKKVAKNGQLNSAGEFIYKLDPFIGYNLAGSAGAIAGKAIGGSSGKRIAARKNGYTYKDFKKRGV